MPKVKPIRGDKVKRSGPLAEDIISEQEVKSSGRKKVRNRKDGDDEYVESDLTKKILAQARQQQLELEEEHEAYPSECPQSSHTKHRKGKQKIVFKDMEDDDNEITAREDEEAVDEDGMQEPVNLDKDAEKAFEVFMTKRGHLTLADIIESKLADKKTEIETIMSDDHGVGVQDVPPRVVEWCVQLRDILKKYRSGKLPKFFKALPLMEHWEPCLYLMHPHQWSAAAIHAATRIYSSNLPGCLAQRFYAAILLPRIRDDIAEYKRLNYHLMQALKRSLFKTGAFFKAIVLALCESGDCTLREATIISSMLSKCSIPSKHGGAAIYQICSMPYTGASSIFLRTLLDKKYTLPYKTIDAVCEHFLRFQADNRQMPVLWHQALLTFAQRFKGCISEDQKEGLYEVMRKHFHPEITPEIRRELESQVSERS